MTKKPTFYVTTPIYYPSGKLYGKINIVNNKVEGTETTYYENGKIISELNYI